MRTIKKERTVTKDKIAHVESSTSNKAAIQSNTAALLAEVEWLEEVIESRLQALEDQTDQQPFANLPAPDLQASNAAYAELIRRMQLNDEERLLLILSFAPYFVPSLLTNQFRLDGHALRVIDPKIGGIIKTDTMQFVPSMQTFLFLVSGDDWKNACQIELELRGRSALFKEQILFTRAGSNFAAPANPFDDLLFIAPEYVDHLKSGRQPSPEYDSSFPARRITTRYEWDDLIVPPQVKTELQEMVSWAKMQSRMAEESYRFDKPYVCLFYGPSGTGKTLSATLLGKLLDMPVYRIDLSMIVSKYIGETEKNLAKVLDKAEHQRWILFFDEADALFSKRTSVGNANDKWANLELSYLLQRLEEFGGIAILATNLLSNMDPAMRRRFRFVTEFPRPAAEERLMLWKSALPEGYSYAKDVDLNVYSKETLTGANISSIIHRCRIKMGEDHSKIIPDKILMAALCKELQKESRTPNYVGYRTDTAKIIQDLKDREKAAEEARFKRENRTRRRPPSR